MQFDCLRDQLKLNTMRSSVLCVAVVLVLAVATVYGAPEYPCVAVGQFVADNADCSIYYMCDASLTPVMFACTGNDCWDKSLKTCSANRIACGCPITAAP